MGSVTAIVSLLSELPLGLLPEVARHTSRARLRNGRKIAAVAAALAAYVAALIGTAPGRATPTASNPLGLAAESGVQAELFKPVLAAGSKRWTRGIADERTLDYVGKIVGHTEVRKQSSTSAELGRHSTTTSTT